LDLLAGGGKLHGESLVSLFKPALAACARCSELGSAYDGWWGMHIVAIGPAAVRNFIKLLMLGNGELCPGKFLCSFSLPRPASSRIIASSTKK
jgi:hypothetical protein